MGRYDVIVFSQPCYALFVKNSLAIYYDPAGQLPVCTDLNRFSYICTELSALALRSFLVKFKSWNIKRDMALR